MAATEALLARPQGGEPTRDVTHERRMAGLSLLAAYAAGEAYSIYAVFVAHSLQPVTFYLSEQNPFLRAVSGKYVEVFNPDGLIATMLVSMMVFGSIWWLLGGVAWTFSPQAYPEPAPSRGRGSIDDVQLEESRV